MKRWLFAFLVSIIVCYIWCPLGLGQQDQNDQTFTMALTGDSIISRRLSVYQEPEFLEMIELIRSADAAFTNLETLFHDYEAYPMHQSGGTYMRAEPALAKELVWAGFDMVARANNPSADYGVLGMHLTTKHLEEAGLVHAGVGNSLAEAREAKFLETAQARLALISCASTFPDHGRAGKSRGDIPARPGLNPLRYKRTYVVTEEQFKTLRQLRDDLGPQPQEEMEEKDRLQFLRSSFEKGEKTDVRTEVNKEDLEEMAAVVRNASRLADLTVVSVHGHERAKSRYVPAGFLIEFARAMIDTGADVYVGHGSHVLWGIEIYKGKPIFYGLGNFIFQNETLLRLPEENYERYNLGPEKHVADFNDARYDFDKRGFPAQAEYWESVIAVPRWNGKKLVGIKLYPIILGHGKSRQDRGRPLLAGPEMGAKIIEKLRRLSEPYGTTIEFQDGIGVVKINSMGSALELGQK